MVVQKFSFVYYKLVSYPIILSNKNRKCGYLKNVIANKQIESNTGYEQVLPDSKEIFCTLLNQKSIFPCR